MSQAPEQFVAAGNAAVDALQSVADTAIDSAERLLALNVNTARVLIEDGVAGVKALIAAKDLQQFIAIVSAQAQPGVDKATTYMRSVYAIAAEAQQALAGLVADRFADVEKKVSTLVEQAAKSAPAGSEFAVSAVKSAFAATSATIDAVGKTAAAIAKKAA